MNNVVHIRSRVGSVPIKLPNSVSCTLDKGVVSVSGPKGTLKFAWPSSLELRIASDVINIFPTNEDCAAIWGTMNRILAGAIQGVQEPWTARLSIKGVGYKAMRCPGGVLGSGLRFALGKSHLDMICNTPSDIKSTVEYVMLGVNAQKLAAAPALPEGVAARASDDGTPDMVLYGHNPALVAKAAEDVQKQLGSSKPRRVTTRVAGFFPEGIEIEVSRDYTKLVVKGTDKSVVGNVAAQIKRLRKPNLYNLAGISIEGQPVIQKEGKKKK